MSARHTSLTALYAVTSLEKYTSRSASHLCAVCKPSKPGAAARPVHDHTCSRHLRMCSSRMCAQQQQQAIPARACPHANRISGLVSVLHIHCRICSVHSCRSSSSMSSAYQVNTFMYSILVLLEHLLVLVVRVLLHFAASYMPAYLSLCANAQGHLLEGNS